MSMSTHVTFAYGDTCLSCVCLYMPLLSIYSHNNCVPNHGQTSLCPFHPSNYELLVNRKLCCSTIKSLFTKEGKHGGEATVEAVRLIAAHVKAHNCQLHPDSVEA